MSLILTTAIASILILSPSTTTYAEALNNVTASNTSEKINITNENLNTEASSETIDGEVNLNDEVNEIINIPDENLKTLINNQLEQNPTSDITKEQALEVTVIMDHSSNISNLDGLQYFDNLSSLSLSDNQISDISPLQNLTNLEYLMLDDNQINDASPLKPLWENSHGEIIISLDGNPINNINNSSDSGSNNTTYATTNNDSNNSNSVNQKKSR